MGRFEDLTSSWKKEGYIELKTQDRLGEGELQSANQHA
jgi:hypothetical protein